MASLSAAEIRACVQRLSRHDESAAPAEGELRRGTGAGAVVVIDADEVAQELAEQGFTTLSVSTSDRSEEVLLTGRSWLALQTDAVLASVRSLRDESRVGLYGAGDGAAVALHAAILSRQPLPLSVSGHTGSYREGNVPGLPGILRYADQPELYASLDQELVQTSGDDVAGFFREAFGKPVTVPFIPPLKVHFDLSARLEVADNIDQVLASGMLTQGKLVGQFEEVAQRFTGVESIAVSTGTAALDIAYQLLEVRDKTVIVPVNTFFATAASVERNGGKVEFVDTELDGFGVDPRALREALDRHDDVAAVVVVHIGGIISPSFKEVLAECEARGIPVVEDAAHALGSKLDGGLAGTFGQLATYSLHPAKVATSGEGGLFGAKDPAHLDAARKLRDHGKISISQNIHDRLGNNWRLSEVHAAVGLAHFQRLDQLLAMRRALAGWYDEHIDDVPRIKRYNLPEGVESNYYKYIAFLDPAVDRTELKARLRGKHGVALAGEVYDVLLADQPYFASRFAGRSFEQAQWFADHHICLPAFPSMTTDEQRHVLHALRTELS